MTDVFLSQKRVNVCELTVKTECVHIHLFSSDQERHLWSSKHMCLSVPFIRRPHFFGNSFLFLFLLLCYPYLGTFLSTWFLLECHFLLSSWFNCHLCHCWWTKLPYNLNEDPNYKVTADFMQSQQNGIYTCMEARYLEI